MDNNFKDEFEKLVSNSTESSKNKIQNKGTRVDTIKIKHRAYEILSENYSIKYLIQCLTTEFGIKERTCYNYIRDIGVEIKQDYQTRIPYLRENIVNKLFKLMDSENDFVKLKAIETLMKLTGIDREQDNSPKEDVKYIIELRADDIEENKKDNDGNE